MSEERLQGPAMESMEDYKEELEKSFRKLQVGDIITGTIISISEEEINVDLKYYTQGILAISDISEDPSFVVDEHYKIGDEIKATITDMDDGQGNIKLSVKEANEVLAWDVLREYQEQEKVMHVKIGGAVNAGVIAYVEGIRGFIPASQLDLSYVEEPADWLNKEVDVVIMNLDQDKNKLVLSAKSVLLKKRQEETDEKIRNLVPGSVFEGTVESIMPYGAFINLGNGLTGLVHISRISQKRIKNPSEVLKTGDKVKVKLLDIKDNKLSLSMKEFEDTMEGETDSMERFDYKEEGEATTSLGSLFAKLNL